MKILITGANGFLGQVLCEKLLLHGYFVIATGRGDCKIPFTGQAGFDYAEMDFTDPFSVHDVFEKYKPEMVVHAGAMTIVDQCEQEQWQTYLTNVEGTVTMLLNAEEHRSFFLFISTDFVFSGDKGHYSESDEPDPVNFYGKTKMEAEEAVKAYEYDWAIVRTSLVYGKATGDKPNILTVVKDKLEKGESYSVVDDQLRTPTLVSDLAAGIVLIIGKKAKGVYHLAGTDILTPYRMAIKVAQYLKLDESLIRKVTAVDFSQPARRPLNTTFNINKAETLLGFQPTMFDEGMKRTIDN